MTSAVLAVGCAIAGRMAINRAMRRKATVAVDTAMLERGWADCETPLSAILAGERRQQVHRGMRRGGVPWIGKR